MTEEMPQAFADAFCNLVVKEFQKTDQEWAHVRNRYRGIEGKNGVCCEACKGEAYVLWVEYQRILEHARSYDLQLKASRENE
jgi:hypothetical protein